MSLKLQNVSKQYGDRPILRDVSFEAARGEIYGLIGENAVGKSTILRIIAGGEKLDAGRVLFDGLDVTDLSERERGFISLENSVEEANWKSVFKARKTEDVSGGLKQKALIEKGIEASSSVLLLDSPFSVMNYELRDEFYQNLRRQAKEKNIVVILATNNLESAYAVCDRVGILQNGEIVQSGALRELYENPASAAVARSLGRVNLVGAQRITFNNEATQEFQTSAGSHRIVTGTFDKNRLGAINQPVLLAIRPEHVSISFGASFPEDNLLKAKITDIRYQGATTLLTLDAEGLVLESLVLRLVGLHVGDDCLVGIPPDRIMVLKD